MTKQPAKSSESLASQGLNEAGAPEITSLAVSASLTALQRCERLLRLSLPIPRESVEESTVAVVVGTSVLRLPERVLSAGASALRAASGEYVGLRDYADSVGPFLAALERQGLIHVLPPALSRDEPDLT